MGPRARADRAVPSDEHRGRVRQVVPRRARQHRRDDPEPRRLDALRLVDPRRARALEDPARRGAPFECRRARRVAEGLRPPRPRRRTLRRPGRRRLPSRSRISKGERVNDRLARLQERLEQPLLVTNPVNVVYLAGFQSSNAALLVERDRVRLFTDFRYIQAARAVEHAEIVQTKRNIVGELAETLTGPVGFEANTLTYASYEVLKRGTAEPVATYGIVEQLRAVKDERELESLRKACAITDRVFERLTEVPSSAAPSATWRGTSRSSSTRRAG